MIPLLVDVAGDPVGVRGGARRLVAAAESLSGSARVLSDSNLEAVRAWDGASQRMFSLITEGFSEVVSGAAGIASEFAAALDRYAGVLEVCQGEVRMCRQRLDALAAATPVGMVPDQVSVGVLVGQANDAFARAVQAARELAVVAVGLMGSSGGSSVVPVGSDANATFVSQAHSVGLAPAHPAAAAFDVQAAHIQSQMNGVMASLAGHTSSMPDLSPSVTAPGAYSAPAFELPQPNSRVVVDPNALPPSMLSIQTRIAAPSLTVEYPGGATAADPDDLVMVAQPYSVGGTGGRLGILVDTTMKANPASPTALSQSESAYRLGMLLINQPSSPFIEDLFDHPARIDFGLENDTYVPYLDPDSNPYNSPFERDS